MSRIIRIATVQGALPRRDGTPRVISARVVQLLEQAAMSDIDIVCLPEYTNAMNATKQEATLYATTVAEQMLNEVGAIARLYDCNVVLPMLIEEAGKRYNRAYIIDRTGQITGHYDKVHIPKTEFNLYGVIAGTEWPVFECDFGRIGVMTCYDGCFLESSRLLALGGAEIIFWPSLQRSYTETELDLQIRAHAYFNFTPIVRSSFGIEYDVPWTPIQPVGLSGICSADGTILAGLGHHAGWTAATIDLDQTPIGTRSYDGEVGPLRTMQFTDRCPETYRAIVAPTGRQGICLF